MIALFPALVRLSLAVQNLSRRPRLVHHVICTAAYIMIILLRITDVIVCAIVALC